MADDVDLWCDSKFRVCARLLPNAFYQRQQLPEAGHQPSNKNSRSAWSYREHHADFSFPVRIKRLQQLHTDIGKIMLIRNRSQARSPILGIGRPRTLHVLTSEIG